MGLNNEMFCQISGNKSIAKNVPPKYVSGARIKVGTMFISSQVFAETIFFTLKCRSPYFLIALCNEVLLLNHHFLPAIQDFSSTDSAMNLERKIFLCDFLVIAIL